MVDQQRIISLCIGATKIEFAIRRLLNPVNYADVAIAMTIDGGGYKFESMATLIGKDDLRRFGEYIAAGLIEEPDYDFVPLNLGFEFRAYDNDDYVSTISLFLLSAEPEGQRRSYVGCKGPIPNESLILFANELKEIAT